MVTPIEDDSTRELPPEDGGDGEEAPPDLPIEYDQLPGDDPFDDASGEDDPIDEELCHMVDPSVSEDDAESDLALEELVAFPDLGRGPDMEEPGIGAEAFELDDEPPGLGTGDDGGAEGPSEADEELRAEDLPDLDADEEEQAPEDVLLEALEEGALGLVARGGEPPFSWADRAWERTAGLALGEGVRGLDRVPGGALALGEGGLFVASPSRVEWRAARGLGEGARGLAVARGALSPGELRVLVGGKEPRVARLSELSFAPTPVAETVDVPLRPVGTSDGFFALGRRGALLGGDDFVAVDVGGWAHAAGRGLGGELVVLVLDEESGELGLERGASLARTPLSPLPDDHVPHAVAQGGAYVVCSVDGAGLFRAFGSGPFAQVPGSRHAGAFAVVDTEGTVLFGLSGGDSRVWLVRVAVQGEPRIVAEIDGASSDDGALAQVTHLVWDAEAQVAYAGTSFGLFVVKPA